MAKTGALADLKVDQWTKATMDGDWMMALKIEPSTPPWEGAAIPAEYKDAEAVLVRWLATIKASDLATYQQCLHSETRKVNEYGTAEAMTFWSKQIKDLHKDGFKGEWTFEKPAAVSERFPSGAVKALPVVNGKPGREAILLMPETGQWVIVRIF